MAAARAWYFDPGCRGIRQIPLRYQSECSDRGMKELYDLVHTDVIDGRSCSALDDDPNAIYMLYFDDEATFKKGVPFNQAASKVLSKLPIPWRTFCGWFIIMKIIKEHAVDDSVHWSKQVMVPEKAVDMDSITPKELVKHWNKMKGQNVK